jgi:hypothetical protein
MLDALGLPGRGDGWEQERHKQNSGGGDPGGNQAGASEAVHEGGGRGKSAPVCPPAEGPLGPPAKRTSSPHLSGGVAAANGEAGTRRY